MNYPDIFKRNNHSIFVPMISFHYRDLFKLILENGENLDKDLEILRKEMKIVTNQQYDDSHFVVSNIYGDIFRFMIIGKPYSCLSIWNMTDFGIGKAIITNNREEAEKNLNDVKKRMEIYTEGKIHCSGCDNIEDYNHIKKHRWFAGIYCDNCWETKYKAIEAKENYS